MGYGGRATRHSPCPTHRHMKPAPASGECGAGANPGRRLRGNLLSQQPRAVPLGTESGVTAFPSGFHVSGLKPPEVLQEGGRARGQAGCWWPQPRKLRHGHSGLLTWPLSCRHAGPGARLPRTLDLHPAPLMASSPPPPTAKQIKPWQAQAPPAPGRERPAHGLVGGWARLRPGGCLLPPLSPSQHKARGDTCAMALAPLSFVTRGEGSGDVCPSPPTCALPAPTLSCELSRC